MKRIVVTLIAGLVLSVCLPWTAFAGALVVDRFEGDLGGWDVKAFKGQTLYELVDDGSGNRVLQADSRASASGLVKYLDFRPEDFPILRWRWKVAGTVRGGDATTKQGDDYAARVYVIFPHWIKPLSRTINYIWANKLPRGEAVPNRFFSRAMMVAVESGTEKAGQWVSEERNIVSDYRRLFGEDPPAVGGVAIMSDTDNTGASAMAWYDDLVFYPAQQP